MGFIGCDADQCVFYRRDGEKKAILAIYVDDMMLATNWG